MVCIFALLTQTNNLIFLIMTYQYLKDYYPAIFYIACQECKRQGKAIPPLERYLYINNSIYGFSWDDSKLGGDFWTVLNNHEIEKLKKLYPSVFIERPIVNKALLTILVLQK